MGGEKTLNDPKNDVFCDILRLYTLFNIFYAFV